MDLSVPSHYLHHYCSRTVLMVWPSGTALGGLVYNGACLHSMKTISRLLSWLATWNWPNSQMPECICSISHNAFRTEMCTFLFWMEHCGIWNRCILGFVKLVYTRGTFRVLHSRFVIRELGLTIRYDFLSHESRLVGSLRASRHSRFAT